MTESAIGSRVRLIELGEEKAGARAISAALLNAIDDGLNKRGRATIALSGGRTPTVVLPRLFSADRDWQHVTFTLTDDRCVCAAIVIALPTPVRAKGSGTGR